MVRLIEKLKNKIEELRKVSKQGRIESHSIHKADLRLNFDDKKRVQQEEEYLKQEQERKRIEEALRKQDELRIKEEQERLKVQEQQRTLQNGPVKLYFDNQNRFHIYYGDNELTKGAGLNTGIFSEGNWYGSVNSKARIQKPSSEEMLIHLSHNQIPLTQIWHLKLGPEGILSWEVDMHLRESLRIDQRNASFFLSKAYKNWFAPPAKEGKFPSSFGYQWQGMTSHEDKPEFIGVFSDLQELPSVVLRNSRDSKGLLLVHNSDLNLSSRVLEIKFEEEKEFYQPGTHPFLKAAIQLYPDKSILKEECLRQEQQRTLQNGPVKLYFDNQNRFHIYYGDNELTKGAGLNTGIFSEGNWYGSVNSKARIQKPSSEEMLIHLSHNQIPLTQIWHLKLGPEGILSWEVDMHLRESLRIDQRNASFFLSKAYKNWFAPPAKEGKFPSSFGYQWQGMTSHEDKPEFIGVFSDLQELPSVVLRNSRDSKGLLLVHNSDLNLSSRVLEIKFEEEKEFYQPGTHPFLRAAIQFYIDKGVLEDILNRMKQEREAELKKQEEEERKKQEEEERKKQEEERKRQEELEKKERAYIEFKEEIESITPNESNSIYIFDDCEELHDKINSCPGNFRKSIAKIKIAQKGSLNIKIGISRFNFFKLNAIAQFCSTLMNNRLDLRSLSLNPFPVHNFYSHFKEYIKELNVRLKPNKITLFLHDEKLLDLLYSISSQADHYNEKDLIRLLGLITEHPFIGPQTIVLDTYHRCNTNCVHCWIHNPKRKLAPGVNNLKMGLALFKNIVDDAVKLLCDEIIFQGDGEPLLDSRFFEMVRYARDRGLKVLFFTNGILLDKEKAKKIIDLEINEIFCSLPAGTDKTYARINSSQTKNTFHKIVDNLRNLIVLRNNLKRNKPLLQISHVIHNLNYHELEEMSRMDVYIGADKARFYLVRLDENIEFLKLNSRCIEAIKRSLKKIAPYFRKRDIELQDNINFQLRNYDPSTGYWSKDKFLKTGCPVGWFFSLILARGEVSLCCHLRIIDYLKRKSFQDIWNSKSYNKFRVQAKYLMKNNNATFLNGVKLYDKFCNHCDTHQVILNIRKLINKYKLGGFLKESI